MAFTFVVEDGTGLSNSNSYVSVSEADDILSTNIHATSWSLKTLQDKEKLLAWATRLIDTKATWFGHKTYSSSSLRWPRTGITSKDSVEIELDEIPKQLKEATSEMARFLVDTDRTVEQSKDGIISLKVDVIEMKFDKDYRLTQLPSIIWEILSDLGYFGVSTGAARIIRA
jgi:hypothetical protein